MENIPKINTYEKMFYWNPLSSNPKRKKVTKNSLSRKSRGSFFRLTKMMHDTHQSLKEKGSPLRLNLNGDENDMSMDIVLIDKIKKVSQHFTRPIKKTNLKTIIKSIHNQIGLVLDYSV